MQRKKKILKRSISQVHEVFVFFRHKSHCADARPPEKTAGEIHCLQVSEIDTEGETRLHWKVPLDN